MCGPFFVVSLRQETTAIGSLARCGKPGMGYRSQFIARLRTQIHFCDLHPVCKSAMRAFYGLYEPCIPSR